MLRILSATVLTAFAQESGWQVPDVALHPELSDVDLHFELSDEVVSLMQLRATNKHGDSEAQPEWTMPDGQPMIDWIFGYDLPPGWRIGWGLGNRSAPQWIMPNGQANVRITHKFVDYKQRSLEECVAEVQRNDAVCPDANGVSYGMVRWQVSSRGERYMAGYSMKCICDFCWNPIPQDWIQRPFNKANWVPSYDPVPPSGESSNGCQGGGGWLTAGPGTLDPSKYSEKRKAAIIKRQNEFCGNMDGWDPLLGMQTTTTTTTTQAAVEQEDSAGAVGDPHLTTIHGEKFDLDQHHLSHGHGH